MQWWQFSLHHFKIERYNINFAHAHVVIKAMKKCLKITFLSFSTSLVGQMKIWSIKFLNRNDLICNSFIFLWIILNWSRKQGYMNIVCKFVQVFLIYTVLVYTYDILYSASTLTCNVADKQHRPHSPSYWY